MTGRLRDKVAIVTGAASGIGAETAVRLAAESAEHGESLRFEDVDAIAVGDYLAARECFRIAPGAALRTSAVCGNPAAAHN